MGNNFKWSNVFWLVLFGLVGFLFGRTTLAYEVPKDAVIKVFDAKGSQIGEMSRADYKVVKADSQPTYIYSVVEKPIFIKNCKEEK